MFVHMAEQIDIGYCLDSPQDFNETVDFEDLGFNILHFACII